MRNATKRLAMGLLIILGDAAAFTADPPKAQSNESKTTATAAKESKELKLPPGWKQKKRGKFILYCKKEAPMGTRLKSETCYDEDGMRNYILALQEEKANVDRIRSTCSNQCTCGNPAAC